MANRESVVLRDDYSALVGFRYFFYKNIIKVAFDFLVALPIMILSVPFYGLVKLAYVLTGDFDGIFYKQKRVGENGKVFTIYKIRTMVLDPDGRILAKILKDEKYKKEWHELQKLTDDPSITTLAKILRNTSLDELPQFLNILKGQLALVGPRPLVPGELKKHRGDASIYESVRPGLTGWWAVSGRSDLLYQKRLQLEYYYVNHFSMKLDLKILFKTVRVVLLKEGAR